MCVACKSVYIRMYMCVRVLVNLCGTVHACITLHFSVTCHSQASFSPNPSFTILLSFFLCLSCFFLFVLLLSFIYHTLSIAYFDDKLRILLELKTVEETKREGSREKTDK